ncbi:MAG: glycogen/starch synthase [bacterium]|nr:glycogen/starch synthase [bacterium]
MPLFFKSAAPRILFVGSEAAPFAKIGGLGEVMFSLPRALNKLGYDARIMIPRYAGIDLRKFNLEMELEGLHVPTDIEDPNQPENLICNVRKYTSGTLARSPATTYFLENFEYYEKRANVYGYNDDSVRWALLCRGVLEFLRRSKWVPDVIVSADWQIGILPNYLKTIYKEDQVLSKIATVFSIHNLFYQGLFDHHFVNEMDDDDGKSSVPSFFDPRLLKINGMRRGIMYADIINTVSPTYAREIMTKEYGELLDGLLRERRSRVYGVINGIDYEVFNPETNPHLAKSFDANSLKKRSANKLELQARFGLPKDEKAFVVSIVARLTEQKGLDLLLPVAEALLKETPMQLVVLGSGEAKYMSFFQDLEKKHPKRVAAHLSFDFDLPHLVYAGADVVLIPSRFEPSGLSQMEAMRYGCIPIARKTGGLADTVEDYDPQNKTGLGFVFNSFDSISLVVAMMRAYEIYRNPEVWQKIQQRAMNRDFSWKQSAADYGKLFETAKAIHGREVKE